MSYEVGIDLGTTYTAAAVHRDGRVEIASLGDHTAAIPSAVFVKDDGSVLTGEAAVRRGLTTPDRLASQYKRRLGDTTPLLLGGAPYSPEALTAHVLRGTVEQVAEVQGGPPAAIAVTHPANWGAFKIDRLAQAVRLADLPAARLLTEPEAAAIFYASTERVEPGALVAVYDLGGGTFDSAVLRQRADGWEIVGTPEGIEQLGGVDFDEAVFEHVRRSVPGAFDGLDSSDASIGAALARIRRDCVDAKEALSSDSEVSIPILLPGLNTQVRLTRAEFEGMIRPALEDTIGALRRALRSADVAAEDLAAVLLVGGSSRIPLVAQLVTSELSRPVAVDTHPKHSVALGAALATTAASSAAPHQVQVEPGVEPAAPASDTSGPAPAPVPPSPAVGTASVPPGATAPTPTGAVGTAPAPAAAPSRSRRGLLLAVGALVLVAAAVGAAIALGGGGGGGGDDDDAKGRAPTTAGASEISLSLGRAVQVPEYPDGIARADDGRLYVASTRGDELSRIDPATGERTALPLPPGSEPLAVAITDDGAVWVTLRKQAAIVRVDPATFQVTDTLPVVERPAALGVGEGSLWVLGSTGVAARIDPGTKAVTTQIDLPARGIAFVGTSAWVTQYDADVLAEVDGGSGSVARRVDVGGGPDTVAVDDQGALWVSNRDDGSLSRIDPERGEVTDTVRVGTAPADLVATDGLVWVSDNAEGKVVVVDTRTHEVVAERKVGAKPLGITADGDTAWISLSGDDEVVEVDLERG